MDEDDRELFNFLLNMKLHEVLDVNEILTVMRVPGGWTYIIETHNEGLLPHAITSTFVPVPYTEVDLDTE